MKLRYICKLFFLLLFINILPAVIEAKSILVIQSGTASSFDIALNSFLKQMTLDSDKKITIDKILFKNDISEIKDQVNSDKYSLLVAVGQSALKGLKELGIAKPVLFFMVIDYKGLEMANSTGITMVIPMESLFMQHQIFFPNYKRVIGFCSQSYYDKYLKNGVSGIRAAGINLDIRIVSSKGDMTNKVENLSADEFDAIWMIPDSAMIDRSSLEAILKTAIEKKKISIVFSEKFVQAGGMFSISPNYESLGAQAAIQAQKILFDNVKPSSLGVVPPLGTKIILNESVIRKIGLQLEESVINSADKVHRSND